MSITTVETFDNQTVWTPFNSMSGTYTINSGKLTYTNTSTTQGVLLSPYSLEKTTSISFDIQLISDPQNRQHAGCWLYDYQKNNWFRFSFLDSTIQGTQLINYNPSNASIWSNDFSKTISPTFNSKNIFNLKIEIDGYNIKIYLNSELINSRVLNFIPLGFAIFAYGSQVNIDNLVMVEKDPIQYSPVLNSWWSIYNNTCLFAIDNNSGIYYNGTLLITSNGSLLNSEAKVPDKITKNITSGVTYKNFTIQHDYVYTYKSISFKKLNLIFNNPITLPNEFTLILKCKVNTRSVFLNKSLTVDNAGPVFEGPNYTNSSQYRFNWRISNFQTGNDYAEEVRKLDNPYIDTLIIKGNLSNRNVSFITSYGTYVVPSNSSAFTTFLQTQTYEVIGYLTSNPDWSVDADIIAYGLFNKEFSTDQINTMLSKIDEEFLTSKIKTHYQSLNIFKFLTFNISSTLIPINLSGVNYIKPVKVMDIPLQLVDKVYIKDLMITDIHAIKDYVYKENIGVRTTLFLYERESGELIYKTESDDTGYFEFNNLDKNLEYVVTSNDKTHQFKSIIKNYDR